MLITKEMMYEWQMQNCIKELLSCEEKSIDDFSPDGLMDFIELYQVQFSAIVVKNMFEWTSNEDWFDGVQN